MSVMLLGCYRPAKSDLKTSAQTTAQTDSSAEDDSISTGMVAFYKSHHYALNYNFVVKTDSLELLRQQPEEYLGGLSTDSFQVPKNSHLAVVDIRILHDDPIDSVWIQLARDQYTFGWVHESRLLRSVVPDDPISQFISIFSEGHTIVSLVVISIIAIFYMVRSIRRKKAHVVHFNDIGSFYPTLLALSVAAAATFYSSIQMFAPDTWRHFYFHPSLNPFAVPPLLSVFLASVWAIVIMTIATIDDVYHKLEPAESTFYLCGLAAVCSANYIVFSLTTLYYVGYPLLVLYAIYAVKLYIRHNLYLWVCGNCGNRMKHKGRCPKCGAENL